MPRRSKCEDEKGKTRERKNGRLDFAVKKNRYNAENFPCLRVITVNRYAHVVFVQSPTPPEVPCRKEERVQAA